MVAGIGLPQNGKPNVKNFIEILVPDYYRRVRVMVVSWLTWHLIDWQMICVSVINITISRVWSRNLFAESPFGEPRWSDCDYNRIHRSITRCTIETRAKYNAGCQFQNVPNCPNSRPAPPRHWCPGGPVICPFPDPWHESQPNTMCVYWVGTQPNIYNVCVLGWAPTQPKTNHFRTQMLLRPKPGRGHVPLTETCRIFITKCHTLSTEPWWGD